jgi:hypothetical protein
LPISRASQLENTIADLVRPLNSDRSVDSARSFPSVWLPKPDGVFDQNIVIMRSYGGARSSAHLMLMKVNLGSATNALCSNRTFRHYHYLSHGTPSRAQNTAKAFQRGLKLRRRRTMCAASKSEIVMSLRWAKRSSISLRFRRGRPRTARLQHHLRTEAPCAIAMRKEFGKVAC